MSPVYTAAFSFTPTLLGGQQSARTLHFFATLALIAFTLERLLMVYGAGFVRRVRAMISAKDLPS